MRRDNGVKRESERGVSLVLIGLGLVMMLGLAGLGVDLATLYVARNEAQRSADAAALAGAKTFVSDGTTFGAIPQSDSEATAAQQAAAVGNQNLVVGRSPNLDPTSYSDSCSPLPSGSGVCFNFSYSNDPRITVVVHENMPTYFMKIFGISTVPVSATATAEAYNPSGATGPSNTVSCLKPWLLPNCDAGDYVNPTGATGYEANEMCQPDSNGNYPAYFVYPTTQPAQVSGAPTEPAIPGGDLGDVVRPETVTASPAGAIGEYLQIKAGSPAGAAAPSQFYPVFLPGSSATSVNSFVCPSCATSDKQNSTSNSASLYRANIECCSTYSLTCGTDVVNPVSGNMVGPTGQGVDCLIHEGNNGSGQDTIQFNPTSTLPYTIYSGGYYQTAGTPVSTSDSLVTLPLYDGAVLCPGNSCSTSVQVTVQGFLQLFINNEGPPNHTVYANVLSISSCGGTSQDGSTGETAIPATTGTQIPVRLVSN